MKYEFISVELYETWTEHERNKGGFRLSWMCKDMSPFGAGWGTVTFFNDLDGKLICDNERMDEEFVKQALLFFVQNSIFIN